VDKLLGLPPANRDQILRDLRDHLKQAVEDGASPMEAVRNMGDPRELAIELMSERQLEYAGFWVRTVAFFIDLIIMSMITVPLFLLPMGVLIPGISLIELANDPWLHQSGDLTGVITVFLLIVVGTWTMGVVLLYFPLSEYLWGATPGKRLFNLRVVQEDGTSVRAGAAFIRRLSLYFDIIVLDAIFIPFNERKQRALDKVAETVVIRE
jgi:uncharacterized RDD family membrane protein YckC